MSNMVVRTNIFALNAHRNMKNVGLEQGRASNRLSSGFRINSAADDAAGLAISENMRAQIRGLDQASRNAQDGQAMLLTTEGGLEEIGNMLQRVRELVVQGANDTNTQNQRDMIDQEINQLSQEIASMQQRVEFNTNRVLAMGPAMKGTVTEKIGKLERDGSRVSFAFNAIDTNRAAVAEAREMLLAIGDGSVALGSLNARQRDVINRALSSVTLSQSVDSMGAAGTTAAMLAGGGNLMEIAGGAAGVVSLFQLNDPAGSFNTGMANIGVVSISGTGNAATMILGAQTIGAPRAEGHSAGGAGGAAAGTVVPNRATPIGTDVTANVAQALQALDWRDTSLDAIGTRLNIYRANMGTQSATQFDAITDFRNAPSTGENVAWFQVGANANQGIQYDFENVSRAVTSAASTVRLVSNLVANPDTGSGIGRGVEVSPLINRLQASLDDVNNVRANLGAVQNRMDYTMRSLDISSENLSDSESRVRNADIAREMMRFTMANVLQQASVSMLAQANQLPNNLLQLLR